MKLSGGGGWPYRHLGDIIDIPGGHVRLGLRAIIIIIIIIIIANFYTCFSHEAQSAYSVLLPRSLDTFQCRTYSAQFPLPREHSLPGIAAYNGAGKFKHNNLSPPTGSPFIRLGREQQCG